MKPSDLAILIPTRNRPLILKRTMDELRDRGFGRHPLLVYDDASDDPEAIQTVVSSWPESRLLRGQSRCGQARGRNQLLQVSPSPYALLLDDDSWPEDYQSVMRAVETARQDQVSLLTFQYRSLADGKLSMPPERPRGPAATFLGGASLFHVPDILACGGYRECLVYGYEEPELALRLWIGHWKIEYLPDVVVAHNHFENPNEKRDYREYDYLYARNGILMSSFNLPLWLGLPHGLLRSLRRSWRQKRHFGPKAAGTLAGLSMTFTNLRERKPCSSRQALAWLKFSRKCL